MYSLYQQIPFNIKISGNKCRRCKEGSLYICKATSPVRTTRPEKYDILAQHYQSQPITTKFQKHCLYFLNLQKSCQNISLSEYFAKCLNAVCRKTLSIRTDRTDKTVKSLIRLLHASLFAILSASSTHHTARKTQTVQF